MFNVWLPGGPFFVYNDGVETSFETNEQGAAKVFVIPNEQSGFGIVAEQFTPELVATKPLKVMYASDKDCTFGVKDSAGWMWEAPMRKQDQPAERGWAWSQFELAAIQDADKENQPLPSKPSDGNIQAVQFRGADQVTHPVTLRINYVAGRTPQSAGLGEVKMFKLECRESSAINIQIGDVNIAGSIRDPIRYKGSLPFGFMLDGPSRARVSSAPYRGPFIAGYQSGTPWVDMEDQDNLNNMLDFMIEAQRQFTIRHPQGLHGPFMHCFLPKTWDSEQTGDPNTWVWDAPDGNPAWNGWQYRAFDAMCRTWSEMAASGTYPETLMTKIQTICLSFMNWMYDWLNEHPTETRIPSDWGPPGWSQGQPMPADSYLDPRATYPSSHDMALVLKGAIFSYQAGADQVVCKEICRRMISMMKPTQYRNQESPMRGAFTLNPEGYEVYGFHQGEVLEALGLALRIPELFE